MKAFRIITGIILLFSILASCATVETDREWSRFKSTALERTGHEIIWEKSEENETFIRKQVEKLLTDGLSRDEAVKIALLNNRVLQSKFEEIGIAKSDLVQAGLFHNPSLGALFRFPFDGGSTNIETDALFTVSDFWQIPFRKKVAAAQLEVTMMTVGQSVLDTTAEAKLVYDKVYYLSLTKREMEKILKNFEDIRDQVKIRHDFGFMSDLDVYLSEIMVADAELEFHRIENELSIAKAYLDRVLGLRADQTKYTIMVKQKYNLQETPNLEEALQHASRHRLDIQMALFKITEAERKLRLEKMRILKELRVGASYERGTDGEEVFGPAIDIQIPLFDQNQAQISKAEFMVRKAQKRLQALEGQLREEIIADLGKIEIHKTNAQLLKEKIMPLRQKALEYANKWVSAMQLNRLYLLEAQKGLLQNQLDYLKARVELDKAIVELERDLGGQLPKK